MSIQKGNFNFENAFICNSMKYNILIVIILLYYETLHISLPFSLLLIYFLYYLDELLQLCFVHIWVNALLLHDTG